MTEDIVRDRLVGTRLGSCRLAERSWATWFFGILAVVAIVSFGVRVGGWASVSEVARDVPIPSVSNPPLELSVDQLREKGRLAKCGSADVFWWRVIEEVGDDLEAYKAIAQCRGGSEIEGVLADTRNIFEQSKVLALVPRLLDELHVKDLVPILDEVQVKKDKSVVDYLFMSRAMERMGDPKGAASALRDAMSLDPKNSDVRMAFGHLLVSQGRVAEARLIFRTALREEGKGVRPSRLYVVAVAFPYAFLFLIFALTGFASVAATRRDNPGMIALTTTLEITHAVARRVMLSSLVFTGCFLAVVFLQTADRAAFGMLGLMAIAAIGWLVYSPFREPIAQLVAWLTQVVSSTFRGRIYKRLASRTAGEQFGILVTVIITITFLVPLIPSLDVRLLMLVLLSVILVSTVGTLILSILDHLASLKITLRWLAVSGTIPFLLFFLNLESERLLAGWMTKDAWVPVLGYAGVWLVGVALALLLARILSRSILSPLDQIMVTVDAVRSGHFEARTQVRRSDEIGQLAHAVDDMAEGLGHREHIKETFRQYVDPAVAERLMERDSDMERGRLMRATVMFSDVRGFTTLSEGLEPAEIVAILNDYFGRMTPIVQRYGGVVDKFIGDGMMAVWGAPVPVAGEHAGQPEPLLATKCGLEMLQALAVFNAELEARGLAPLQIGIGINEGPLIAGPLGSPERKEYTVIGDTVNTAARFEGVARGDHPLVVGKTVADVIADHLTIQELEPMQLKGKADAVPVWRVLP